MKQQGGQDNYELAKTYYSQAVKLNPNNLRALYGLYLVIKFNYLILLFIYSKNIIKIVFFFKFSVAIK